jgi:hypothetical protein
MNEHTPRLLVLAHGVKILGQRRKAEFRVQLGVAVNLHDQLEE